MQAPRPPEGAGRPDVSGPTFSKNVGGGPPGLWGPHALCAGRGNGAGDPDVPLRVTDWAMEADNTRPPGETLEMCPPGVLPCIPDPGTRVWLDAFLDKVSDPSPGNLGTSFSSR